MDHEPEAGRREGLIGGYWGTENRRLKAIIFSLIGTHG